MLQRVEVGAVLVDLLDFALELLTSAKSTATRPDRPELELA